MQIFTFIIWICLGAGLAYVFLITQRWSAQIITPEYPRMSKWIIVGGAVMRWIIVSLVFYLILINSPLGLLIVFSAFMISRFILLIKWYHPAIIPPQKLTIGKEGSWRR